MITWKLTEEQVQQITNVLDITTKATGINGAKVTVPLMDSLMMAVEASKEQSGESGQSSSLD